MKTLEIYGKNYAGHTAHTRYASRGVLIRDNCVLLSHERAIDRWMIPGGGREGEETAEECCVREFAEETGIIVRPEECFLLLKEYYEDRCFVSEYFTVEAAGETQRRPTEREIAVDAQPEWLPLQEAFTLFSRHADYAEISEEKRGLYFREYTALTELRSRYVIVRDAEEKDLERLNELREAVHTLHAVGRPDWFRPDFCAELRAEVSGAMLRETHDVLVAETDGGICGYVIVEYMDRPETPQSPAMRFCHIHEIGVDAAFRRKGVGKTLIAEVRRRAVLREIPRVELSMWEFNADALAFYESLGFETYLRRLEMRTDA